MCAKNMETKPLGFDTIISQLRIFGKTFAEKAPHMVNIFEVFAQEIEKASKAVGQHIETQAIILANALNELNETKAKLDAIEKLTIKFQNEGGAK